MLATAVVGVSLAWACTGGDVGVPAAGTAPPNVPTTSPSTNGGGGPTTSGGAGAGAAAGSSSASSSTASGSTSTGSGASSGSTASGSTSGATRSPQTSGGGTTRSRSTGGGTTRSRSTGGSGASSGSRDVGSSASPSSQFTARVQGATAGVTSRGGQPVFASSVAPKKSGANAASPSTRSAVGDVWSGFGPSTGGSPSVSSAAHAFSPGGQGGGSGGGAGIAILGIGLVGALGTFLVAGLRRRRSENHGE